MELMHNKLVIILLLIICTGQILASQDAMVIKNRSIVYADKMLTSPIGYLRSGIQVKVGSVPRNNGQVLPILLKGKVAYVEVKNLSFDTQSNMAKSRMEAFRKETAPKLYVNYSYNISGLGDQWSDLSNQLNEDDSGSLITHRLDFEIHPPNSKSFGTLGLGYSTLTQNTIAIRSYIFSATAYYSIFKFRHFTFDLVGGIELSPQTKITVRGADDAVTGTTYGWHYGLQVRMMYNLKYGFVAGYYIKNTSAENLTNIEDPNNSDQYTITSLSGSNIYLGISYRFK